MAKDVIHQMEDPDYQASVTSNDTVSAPAKLQATGQLMDESNLPPVPRSQSGMDLAPAGSSRAGFEDGKPPARRPLAGNSRKVLVERISLLQQQIVALQQRVADLSRNTSSPLRPMSIKSDDIGAATILEEDENPSLTSSSPSSSTLQRRKDLILAGASSRSSAADDQQVVQFPSTFASSSYDDPHNTESEYLEQVVTLAGKIRRGLLKAAEEGKGMIIIKDKGKGEEEGKDGEGDIMMIKKEQDDKSQGDNDSDEANFGTSELRQMLMEATPQPENAQVYANAFAKRNLELYKNPEERNAMMMAGPLQQKTQHPRYVDILTRCVREAYIAHIGTFDELEFCLWLVTEVIYHAEQSGSDEDDLDELDDTRYEFSEKFIKRYPFVGTKQLIKHANIWRHVRGESPIVQTEEMINAEKFTVAQQEMSKDGTYPASNSS